MEKIKITDWVKMYLQDIRKYLEDVKSLEIDPDKTTVSGSIAFQEIQNILDEIQIDGLNTVIDFIETASEHGVVFKNGFMTKTNPKNLMKISDGWKPLYIPDCDYFMINSDCNTIVDRRTSRTLKPISGRYEFRTDNSVISIPADEILTYARKPVNRYDNWMTVTAHDDKINMNPENICETSYDSDYRWIDWFDDIPPRRYRVYRTGRVYDTISERNVSTCKSGLITLTSNDRTSRTNGVHCVVVQTSHARTVYKAFHPEFSVDSRKHVKYKDKDKNNVNIENLYI